MGILDSLLNGTLGGMQPSGGSWQNQRSGMSPMILALLGVLAYRTFKGKGRLADMLGTGSGMSAGGLGGGSGLGGGLGGALGGLLSGGALSGGLGNLLNRFRQNGQGDKAESWISNGANQPIAPNELEEGLGQERIQWLREQTGLSKDELLAGLSRHLPQAVSELTPEGRIPTEQEAQRLI